MPARVSWVTQVCDPAASCCCLIRSVLPHFQPIWPQLGNYLDAGGLWPYSLPLDTTSIKAVGLLDPASCSP